MIFCNCFGAGLDGGDRARVRIAEVWALKRNVSAKEISVVLEDEEGGVMFAVIP